MSYELGNIYRGTNGGGFLNWFWGTRQNPRPGQLAWDWFTGAGPSHYAFGPNSQNTFDMMHAAGVNAARAALYAKYGGHPPNGGSLTNYAARFGIEGLLTSDTLTQQFVGSYRVDITVTQDMANFTVSNVSSFQSFAYGIGPAWSRNQSWGPIPFSAPMGNMSQTYQWSESIIPGRP